MIKRDGYDWKYKCGIAREGVKKARVKELRSMIIMRSSLVIGVLPYQSCLVIAICQSIF